MSNADDPNSTTGNADGNSLLPAPIPQSENQGVLGEIEAPGTDKDKEPTERRVREWLQVTVNVVLVIVGIVALFIYYGQLEVMKVQLGEIVKQYPEIRRQAKAATDAVNQSTEAFRIDERAWIALEPITPKLLEPIAGWGKTYRYDIFLKNVGKTVAYNISVKAGNTEGTNFEGAGFGDDKRAVSMWQDRWIKGTIKNSKTGATFKSPSNRIPRVLGPNTTSSAPFILIGQEPTYRPASNWTSSLTPSGFVIG